MAVAQPFIPMNKDSVYTRLGNIGLWIFHALNMEILWTRNTDISWTTLDLGKDLRNNRLMMGIQPGKGDFRTLQQHFCHPAMSSQYSPISYIHHPIRTLIYTKSHKTWSIPSHSGIKVRYNWAWSAIQFLLLVDPAVTQRYSLPSFPRQ